MRRRTATAVASGLLAGVVMAVWAMMVMAVRGDGFLAPLNIIANTFGADVPLDGTFSWTGLLVGTVTHLALSALFGAAFGMLLPHPLRLHALSPAPTLLAGPVFGVMLWLVDHVVLWSFIDTDAAIAFTPWVSLVGHILYGFVLGVGIRSATSRPTARLR